MEVMRNIKQLVSSANHGGTALSTIPPIRLEVVFGRGAT
jgi:hypothetical protein